MHQLFFELLAVLLGLCLVDGLLLDLFLHLVLEFFLAVEEVLFILCHFVVEHGPIDLDVVIQTFQCVVEIRKLPLYHGLVNCLLYVDREVVVLLALVNATTAVVHPLLHHEGLAFIAVAVPDVVILV